MGSAAQPDAGELGAGPHRLSARPRVLQLAARAASSAAISALRRHSIDRATSSRRREPGGPCPALPPTPAASAAAPAAVLAGSLPQLAHSANPLCNGMLSSCTWCPGLQVAAMSAQLVWELVKKNHAFIRKSVNHTVFSAEPGNVANKHRCGWCSRVEVQEDARLSGPRAKRVAARHEHPLQPVGGGMQRRHVHHGEACSCGGSTASAEKRHGAERGSLAACLQQCTSVGGRCWGSMASIAQQQGGAQPAAHDQQLLRWLGGIGMLNSRPSVCR